MQGAPQRVNDQKLKSVPICTRRPSLNKPVGVGVPPYVKFWKLNTLNTSTLTLRVPLPNCGKSFVNVRSTSRYAHAPGMMIGYCGGLDTPGTQPVRDDQAPTDSRRPQAIATKPPNLITASDRECM